MKPRTRPTGPRIPSKRFRLEMLEERIAPKKGTLGVSDTIGGDLKNGWTNNPHYQQY